jgi:hypothetical protein
VLLRVGEHARRLWRASSSTDACSEASHRASPLAIDLKVGEGQQAQEVAAEWVATNKYIVDSWGWGSTTNLSKVNGNTRAARGACWASAAVCMPACLYACPAALG